MLVRVAHVADKPTCCRRPELYVFDQYQFDGARMPPPLAGLIIARNNGVWDQFHVWKCAREFHHAARHVVIRRDDYKPAKAPRFQPRACLSGIADRILSRIIDVDAAIE